MKITIWQLHKYFLNVKCVQSINNIITSTVQIRVLIFNPAHVSVNNYVVRAGKIAHWLRVLAAFLGDPALMSTTGSSQGL